MRLLATAFLGVTTLLASAQAQTYPVKPVSVIVPFAPGGNTDVIGRIIMAHVSKTIGQTFIIGAQKGG